MEVSRAYWSPTSVQMSWKCFCK